MAIKDGQEIILLWVLVDWTHAQKQSLRDALEPLHVRSRPTHALSVNVSTAGSQALIKVAGRSKEDLEKQLSTLDRAAIVRIYTESDHHEAHALVNAAAWTGER